MIVSLIWIIAAYRRLPMAFDALLDVMTCVVNEVITYLLGNVYSHTLKSLHFIA